MDESFSKIKCGLSIESVPDAIILSLILFSICNFSFLILEFKSGFFIINEDRAFDLSIITFRSVNGTKRANNPIHPSIEIRTFLGNKKLLFLSRKPALMILFFIKFTAAFCISSLPHTTSIICKANKSASDSRDNSN